MSIKQTAAGLWRKHRADIRLVVIFTAVLAAAGAAFLFYQNPAVLDTLLVITPKLATERGVDVDAVEEINDEKFMITYTCPMSATADAVQSRRDVALIATNYSFPHVMRYVMKSGGFFTRTHQEQKAKAAVLNAKAAFDLFGGMEIVGNEITVGGAKYSVVGVIDDDETELLQIYIPITLTDEAAADSRPNTFAVRLDERISEAYVKSELKQLGITDTNYEFTRKTLTERLWEAVKWWE